MAAIGLLVGALVGIVVSGPASSFYENFRIDPLYKRRSTITELAKQSRQTQGQPLANADYKFIEVASEISQFVADGGVIEKDKLQQWFGTPVTQSTDRDLEELSYSFPSRSRELIATFRKSHLYFLVVRDSK